MTVKKFLTKNDILKADDIITVEVEVPEWGGTVRVKAITGYERDAIESHIYQTSKKGDSVIDLRALLVAKSVVDEKGKSLFTEKDIPGLGVKSAIALDRVADKARKLAGMTPEAVGIAEKN